MGSTTTAWDRRRLLLALAALAVVAVVLVGGLGYALYSSITSTVGRSRDRAAAAGSGSVPARPLSRDAIADQPMLQVTEEDARPTSPAMSPAPALVIPAATGVGPADVPTGFPRTPEGAVAQLAAIEVTVLQRMSLAYTQTVHRGWALPGGPGWEDWPMSANVRTFLQAADMREELDLSATVTAVPAAGQVKGVDGSGWVLACVLLEVRATITTEARIGYGYCERMQWHTGRWMIGPGAPPATAPSTWPGSPVSVQAGWRPWADPGEG